jgi:hypothetical protein
VFYLISGGFVKYWLKSNKRTYSFEHHKTSLRSQCASRIQRLFKPPSDDLVHSVPENLISAVTSSTFPTAPGQAPVLAPG